MLYVRQAASALAGCLFVLSVHAYGQGLSITNYQFVSEQPWSRTQSYVTYRADLVNTGPARDALTATVSSMDVNVQTVAGQRNLHFPPVPAGGHVTSTNTFTLFVNRNLPFSFTSLQWSFDAPLANAGPDQTVGLGSTVTLNGSNSTNPSGVGTLSYHWEVVSRPGGASQIQNPDSAIARFAVDARGTYVLSLTVTNGKGTDTAFVNISTGNSPPVANAGPNQTQPLGATVHLNGGHSSDPDGDPLTYSWTMIGQPPGSTAALTGATTVAPSFVIDKAGTYVVSLVVRDGQLASTASTVQITTGNTPPVADAGQNQVVNVGAVVQLNGSGSTDVDGDPLTYKWMFNNRPAGSNATLSNPTDVKPSFTVDVAGTYIVQLIVHDGRADSLPATVTITTNSVQPPVANAGPNQTVQHGSLVALNGSATDPQGLPLTLKWSLETKPTGSTAQLSFTNIARPTFVADLPGTYVAQLVANNGFLQSAPSTVTITTTNAAPVADAGVDQSVHTGALVTLNGSNSSDSDHDPLSYMWSLLKRPDGSAAALSAPTSASPTFVADLAGTYVVQLIVSDPFTKSDPKTVTITAGVNTIALTPNPLNLAPNSSGALVITLGEPAGAAGVTVKLASSDAGVVSVPASILVPSGSATATAAIQSHITGSAFILATATGFSPGSTTVNVSPAGITVGLDSSTVGLSGTLHGTITLSKPAAPGGTVVTLTVAPGGIIGFPPSVTVVSGTTADFNITGLALGTATITANSAGFTSGSATVTVSKLGAIKLPASVVFVAPNQSVAFPVSLATPAPVGGVTITLANTDPSIVDIQKTVFIAQGETTPSAQPTVKGLKFGSVTIAATAPGFDGAAQKVTVTAALSFSPTQVTLGVGGTAKLTLNLSAPAPSALTIALSSDNTKVATVPPSVSFATGATSVDVTVSGVGSGSAVIHASSAPFLADTTATASVALVGSIHLPSNLSVTLGATVPFPITLSVPAPAGGTTVTLTISDASKATISPLSVTIGAGKTAPASNPQITGLIGGTLTVSATAPAYSSDTQTVTVVSGISITTVSLPSGTANTAYSATLGATGGKTPYTWSQTGLPTGLTLNTTTGAITGTPTTAGTSTVVITVADATAPTHLTASKSFTLNIASVTTFGIATTSLLNGVVGLPYNATLTTTGGKAPFTWSATGLPSGLTLDASTGVISGTPSAPGPSTVALTVTDSTTPTHLTASKSLPLTIIARPRITTTSLPDGSVGAAYTATLVGTLGTTPYTWSATGLPAGLTLNASTGVISGTPTAAGTNTVGITLTDSSTPGHLTATTSLTLKIVAGLSFNLPVVPTMVVGKAVTIGAPLVSGGTPPYAWSATGLPAGLTISASTGAISGTPTAAGTSTVTLTVTDSTTPSHLTLAKALSLVVLPALNITTTALADGSVGAAYTATLAATGGTAPYSWSATGLPAGLTLNTTTGVISGTPTTTGTSTVAITVTDSSTPTHLTTTKSLTLTVLGAFSITTSSLPNGIVGTAYSATLGVTGGKAPYTWSQTGLPAGLTLNASTGVISGTPTAAGTSTVALTVTDSSTPSHLTTTRSLALVVVTRPSITTTSLADSTVGAAYTATLAGTGGTTPYKWSATGLPAGLTINASTGAISGTPTAAGTSTVAVTLTDSTSPTNLTATKNLTLIVAAPLSITTTSLSGGVVGVAYNATVSATGGTTPYTWSATGLPAGLTINVSTGAISGSPTAAGNSSASITVTDSGNPTHRTATKVLTINVTGSVGITTTVLPSGVVGNAYSATLNAAGGTAPYTWSATGLPAGLTLNASTGVISGTPTTAGPKTVAITVTDSTNPTHATATKNLTLTIVAPPSITNASLPGGAVNAAYTATLAATGGTPPYTWSATGLPAGLTLNSSTGVISGTATAATTNTVAVTVTDSTSPAHLTATKSFSLTIAGQLTIVTTSLPNGVSGKTYSATVAASGGTTPYSWTASGLPAGLTINSSTGVISGITNTSGSSTVQITVTDSLTPTHRTATANLTLIMVGPISITTTTVPTGVRGNAYTATVAATGGLPPYTWSATSLPAGLTINASTGVISGTPTIAGTLSSVITVTDSLTPTHLTATKTLSFLVVTPLSITTTALPGVLVNTAYNFTASATGGTPPYTWSATGLPAGLTINSSTGAIAGTPTVTGTSSVTLKVTDVTNPALTATKTLSLTVLAPVTVTTASLPPAVVGTPYAATLAASGGTAPYTWTATGLPAGLTLNTTTGAITGTPTTGGTATVNVTATDSTSPTKLSGSKTLSLLVLVPVSITTATLPSGVVGQSYSAPVAASGGTGPYTWTATGLPAGLTMSTAGVISGTPSGAGTSTVTVTTTDSTNPTHLTASRNLTLVVVAPVSITTASLPAGVVGVIYPGATLAATGGNGSYTWTATGLPAGLILNPTTGAISGTPSAAATSSVTVTATDTSAAKLSASKTFSIIVRPPVSITTTALPSGVVGTAYVGITLAASGGTAPYTWSATGLPAGLTLNVTTGTISGTPTAAGNSTVTVTATDSTSPTKLTATKTFPLSVVATLAITTTSLPSGVVGKPYPGATLAATGGTSPYTWSATGLPAGLTLNASTGAITGTPTAAGNSTVNVTATDSSSPTKRTATKTFSLSVIAPPVITTASLPAGVTGAAYSVTLAASGGTPPYTWSATGLPAGLGLVASTGVISGTPTVAGTSTVLIGVTDSTNPKLTAAKSLSLVVTAPLAALSVSTATVGQNLQTGINISIPKPAGPGGVAVTVTTADVTKLALGSTGQASVALTIPENETQTSVMVQGLATTGSVKVTAKATGYADGTANITLTPSGFVLAGPNGIGVSFQINQTLTAPLTIYPARLDASGAFVETQQLRASLPAPVSVQVTSTTGGSVVSPVSFDPASFSQGTTFTANATGAVTITVPTPAGYTAVTGGANTVVATIVPAGISCQSGLTVGRNLETAMTCTLSGVVGAAGSTFTITSNDATRLKFSTANNTAGSGSISINLPQGAHGTPDFYVQGFASAGTVGFTAQATGFGTNTGTVNLAPSGIVFTNLTCDVPTPILAAVGGNDRPVTVFSARLTPSNTCAEIQPVAGGLSAVVNITSSSTAVGTLNPTQVTIAAGQNSAITQLHPVSAGTTNLTVGVPVSPAGFSTPSAQYSTVKATVAVSTLVLTADAIPIGKDLEVQGGVVLSQGAPAPGLDVTITSMSSSLLLAKNATDAGQSTIVVTVPAGATSATFYVQALAATGTASYKASAAGYIDGTATMTLTKSGVVLSDTNDIPMLTTTAGGTATVKVGMAQLDPANDKVQSTTQQLRGGISLSVTVNSGNGGILTIDSPVTIAGGTSSSNTTAHGIAAGSTTITAVQPAGFTAAKNTLFPDFKPMPTINVTVN